VAGLEDRRVSPSHRPRLLVAAGEGTLRQDLRGSLTGRFDLLDEVPRGNMVEGAVLGFPCIREPETRRRIRAVREAIRPAPSLLVTSNQTGNLLSLSALVVERVHPLEGGLESLSDVVRTMLDVDPLETLARRVEVCEAMDPVVRLTMVLVLRSRPPIGSVKRLCRELGIGRATLHDHWPRSADHVPCGAADVLRLVALYRAGTLINAGCSTKEAAGRVGWSRRRLETNARSLLGPQPTNLARDLPRLLAGLEEFADRSSRG
jgi:hypothetical protein